jgi:hypothetical protein
LREDTTRTVPRDPGDSALSAHRRPVLDPASTHRRATRKKGRRGTGLGVFSPSRPPRHHSVQRWPAIPGARPYSHLYMDRQNFTSKAPRRPCLLLPYKRAGRGSTRGQGRRTTNNRQRNTNLRPSKEDQHLKQSPLYSHFFFETWARFPLSQLVTLTQALRCKEIQYSPLPAGRRGFFCPNQDKSPYILLDSPSRLETCSI